MVKLIILDLDNTIYNEAVYFEAVFKNFEKDTGLQQGALIRAFNKLNRRESRDILGDCLYYSFGSNSLYKDTLFQYYITLDEPLELPECSKTFFRMAKDRNIPVVVLTNGIPEVQQNKKLLLGLASYVDAFYCAREIGKGKEKPEKIVFDYVLNDYGIDASQAVMLGDDIDKDYFAAKSAGLNAILVEWQSGQKLPNLKSYFSKVISFNE